MKKALLILLAAMICFTGVACRKRQTSGNETETQTGAKVSVSVSVHNSNNSDDPIDESASSTPAPAVTTPKPNDTDTLLYTENDISVYFRSVTEVTGGKEIRFFVENTGVSQKLLTVTIRILTINRYATQTSDRIDLISNSAGLVKPFFWNSMLTPLGVYNSTDISEITVQITAEDSDGMPIFDNQIITFTLE